MARTGLVALCLAAALGVRAAAVELSDRAYALTSYDARATAGYGADYGADVAILQAEVADLRQRLDRMTEAGYVDSSAAGGSCGACDTCGGCGNDCCCGRSGWYFGAAAVWIKPHYKTDKDGLGHAVTVNTSGRRGGSEHIPFATDYEVTPRLWLGYVNCEGGGWRLRYWEYDHGPTAANVTLADSFSFIRTFGGGLQIAGPGTVAASHDLTLRTLDLDVTQRLDHCWGNTITAGFGLRYARMEQVSSRRIIGTNSGVFLNEPLEVFEGLTGTFEGVGPSFALEVQRQVSCAWGVYGSVRHCVLFGDWNSGESRAFGAPGVPPTVFGTTTSANDEPLQITEVEVGLEWRRALAANVLYVRGGYEGQLWHSAGGPFNQSLDLGLEGFGFSAGVLR